MLLREFRDVTRIVDWKILKTMVPYSRQHVARLGPLPISWTSLSESFSGYGRPGRRGCGR
jgi:hypothetical protein